MRPVETAGIRTELGLSHVSMQPGRSTRVSIRVTNTSDVIDGITAIVDGINPDWIRLEQPLISLFPDASGVLDLVFDIPRSCPAGDYLVVARVLSTIEDERQSVHDFWLTVEEVVDLDLTVRPQIVTGGKTATFETAVVNKGNAPVEVTLTALEPTREIDCSVRPSLFTVPFEHDAIVDVVARGSRPWFGQPVQRQITLTARSGDTVVDTVATFNQKPRIPRGLLTVLMLAGIIALWAFIFIWVVQALNEDNSEIKKPATAFDMGGESDVPLSNVAGTAAGRATASTTGAGVRRVAVTALRVAVDTATGEEKLLSVASAATGDDGTFSIDVLVPGRYKFCFSGDGFAEKCYLTGVPRGTPDRDEASVLQIKPKVAVYPPLAIELVGTTGDFTGVVTLPPGGDPNEQHNITVTAAQVLEDTTPTPLGALVAVDPAPPIQGVVDQSTGEFHFDIDGDGVGDLPTPATFLITIAGDNFETQQFEQELGPGATPVLDTVDLAAAKARISGTVRDLVGNAPLGNVRVTARSGDYVARTITPTVGEVGSFVFTDLVTPETYVLTFQREHYATRSVTIDLEAGASTTVNELLSGGSGTVTGRAVSSTTLAGIGQLDVTVTAGDSIATTSTLSDGSFEVNELPVTGTYVVTVSGPGVQPETVNRPAAASRSVDAGVIAMRPTTAALSGSVRFGGAAVAGATVTLSDGITTVSTVTASNPPGHYAFSGIAPGAYALSIDALRLERRVVLVSLDAGATATRDITLSGSEINGTVRFRGEALAGVTVTTNRGQRVVTDGAGRYSLGGLASGPYTLTFTSAFMSTSVNLQHEVVVQLAAGQAVTKDVVLGSTITGTVLIDSLGYGGVTVGYTDGTTSGSVTTSSDPANRGRYTIPDRTAGTHTLTFSKPGLTTKTATVTVVAGADVNRDVTMGSQVTGLVTSGGSPLAGVSVFRSHDAENESTTTGAAGADLGRFVFDDVVPGPHRLLFSKPGFLDEVVEVVVVAGEGITSDVVMTPVSEGGTG